jgi:hypothetical protein
MARLEQLEANEDGTWPGKYLIVLDVVLGRENGVVLINALDALIHLTFGDAFGC